MSDHQAITRTVPQGNGKDNWRWRLTREAEMMGTDDGYLCTYLQGLQHSLWVCIGDTGSLHATEGRDQTDRLQKLLTPEEAAWWSGPPSSASTRDLGKLLQHSEPWFSSFYEETCLIPPGAFLTGNPLCLDAFAHILLSLGEVSGTLLWVRVHLFQGTWKPIIHPLPCPIFPTPQRGHLFSQTSRFLPDIPLLTWTGQC